jgi:hypothetical protein
MINWERVRIHKIVIPGINEALRMRQNGNENRKKCGSRLLASAGLSAIS